MILTGTSLASSYSAPIASVLQFFTIYCIRSELTLPYQFIFLISFRPISFLSKVASYLRCTYQKSWLGLLRMSVLVFTFVNIRDNIVVIAISQLPKTEYIYTNTVKLMIYIVYIVVVVVVVVINMIVVAIKLSNNCKSKETLFKRGGLLQVAVQHPLIQ